MRNELPCGFKLRVSLGEGKCVACVDGRDGRLLDPKENRASPHRRLKFPAHAAHSFERKEWYAMIGLSSVRRYRRRLACLHSQPSWSFCSQDWESCSFLAPPSSTS